MRMTQKRKISLAVHIAFVSIPLVAGALAAVVFWWGLFGSLWFAVPMVVVVEVLALTGLVLYIARVPSPFWALRHLLPFISIVPLAYELYLLLERNGFATAITATTVVASVLIWVAHKCYRTIEDLFIDPAQAAEELAREQVEKTSLMLYGLQAQMRLVHEHAEDYRQTIRVLAAPQLALPERSIAMTQVQPVEASPSTSASNAFDEVPEAIDIEPRVVTPPISPPEPQKKTFVLDDLLSGVGLTRADARAMLERYGLDDAKRAYNALDRYGKLPHGMQYNDFAPLFDELMDRQPTQPKRTMSDLVREYRERGLSVNAIMSLHPDWNKRSVQTIYNNR